MQHTLLNRNKAFFTTALLLLAVAANSAYAEDRGTSGKLLLTGGLTQIEGAAGGGLTPWAVIGGYGTRNQVGANAFITNVHVQNYNFKTYGAMVGLFDRVELSISRQAFDTRAVGDALGLGKGFTFHQNTFGVKVKVAGDAVLEQDSWLPQIAVGMQVKKNDRDAIIRAVGGKDDQGVDLYVSATKLFLSQSLLLNGTVRLTKANQIGILGFGGDKHNTYRPMVEASVAYLLRKDLAVGGEYRQKPDNLNIAKEDDWWDTFITWAPSKNISLTAAYANLGNVVIKNRQKGAYLSLQAGF